MMIYFQKFDNFDCNRKFGAKYNRTLNNYSTEYDCAEYHNKMKVRDM